METLLSSYCLHLDCISSHIMWSMEPLSQYKLSNFAKMSQYFKKFKKNFKNPEMWQPKSVLRKAFLSAIDYVTPSFMTSLWHFLVLSCAIEAYFYQKGIIFRYISHSRQSNTSDTLVRNHWGSTKSGVLNFSELMICESVAGNGCHKTCINKTIDW